MDGRLSVSWQPGSTAESLGEGTRVRWSPWDRLTSCFWACGEGEHHSEPECLNSEQPGSGCQEEDLRGRYPLPSQIPSDPLLHLPQSRRTSQLEKLLFYLICVCTMVCVRRREDSVRCWSPLSIMKQALLGFTSVYIRIYGPRAPTVSNLSPMSPQRDWDDMCTGRSMGSRDLNLGHQTHPEALPSEPSSQPCFWFLR